jgi:hypothetical protein
MTVQQAVRTARYDAFSRRVEYFMVKAAIAKLNAATPTTPDILLGQRILNGEEPVLQWALGVLTNATIMAGAHDDDGKTIVDSDIEFAVNSLWLAFSL